MDDLTHIINQDPTMASKQSHEALALIYEQLKKIAKTQKFKITQQDLNTTALVNEAWLKLNSNKKIFNDRNHFFATSALVMRHILLKQAAAKANQLSKHNFDDNTMADDTAEAHWLLDLERHLKKMGAYSQRLETIFVYRYFGGMKIEEVAKALDLSKRTVEREWKKAKMMLSMAMGS